MINTTLSNSSSPSLPALPLLSSLSDEGKILLEKSITISPKSVWRYEVYLEIYNKLIIRLSASPWVDLYILDSVNYNHWRHGGSASAYVIEERKNILTKVFTAPADDNYYIIIYNPWDYLKSNVNIEIRVIRGLGDVYKRQV